MSRFRMPGSNHYLWTIFGAVLLAFVVSGRGVLAAPVDDISKAVDEAIEADFYDIDEPSAKEYRKKITSSARAERELRREFEEDRALEENWYGILDVEESAPFTKKSKKKAKTRQTVKGFNAWDYVPNGEENIEFIYSTPIWQIEKSSGKHAPIILGMTKPARKAFDKMRTSNAYRCTVKGNFKKEGVYIVKVMKCRGVLIASGW